MITCWPLRGFAPYPNCRFWPLRGLAPHPNCSFSPLRGLAPYPNCSFWPLRGLAPHPNCSFLLLRGLAPCPNWSFWPLREAASWEIWRKEATTGVSQVTVSRICHTGSVSMMSERSRFRMILRMVNHLLLNNAFHGTCERLSRIGYQFVTDVQDVLHQFSRARNGVIINNLRSNVKRGSRYHGIHRLSKVGKVGDDDSLLVGRI